MFLSITSSKIKFISNSRYTSLIKDPSMIGRRVLGQVPNEEEISPTASLNGAESLSCPICNENMINLGQLNQHLDDTHTNNDPSESVNIGPYLEKDLKNWFRTKVVDRANSLHPLISSKLNTMDVVDNMGYFTISDSVTSSAPNSTTNSRISSPGLETSEISRSHWKKPKGNDFCHLKECKRRLNIKNGIVNCRKCGFLFCNEHTYYRLKVNQTLQYDPLGGQFVRCCITCFTNKPFFNNFEGVALEDTKTFQELREKRLESDRLKTIVLEKRLRKIFAFVYDRDNPSKVNNSEVTNYVKQIIHWQTDNELNNCPLCFKQFGRFLMRKHHCRLCGEIRCDDGCSLDIPMNYLKHLFDQSPETNEQHDQNHPTEDDTIVFDKVSLRICKLCKNRVFHKRLFTQNRSSSTGIDGLLSTIRLVNIYKEKIHQLLPGFEEDLQRLQTIDSASNSNQILPTKELEDDEQFLKMLVEKRYKIMSVFNKIDKIAKGLKLTIDQNDTLLSLKKPLAEGMTVDQLKIARSIYMQLASFLQDNMLKLQKVPNLTNKPSTENKGLSKLEIREYRDKLMVLQEQHYLINSMIDDSKKKRKFDDLKILDENLADIETEIQTISRKLGDDSF
ncbi:hypothetical protein LJB42_003644 [Komagataella kurtzmanii]|nr:hypothetical protein LJB42_003644 [Komagataella kurtzmanii]